VLQLILGLFASVIVMAFSRHREFRADEGSAHIFGKQKMISALEALQRMKNLAPKDAGNVATLQINTKTSGGFKKYFMSHPPLEERITRLENIRV